MIALSMQIKAIIFSLVYGVFISFMVNVNYKCLFNKNMILSDDSEMSKESRTSVLLKIWHHTFSQNSLTIAGNDDDHKIFKKLQQNVEQVESPDE